MESRASDARFMTRALQLARRAQGDTSPNPMVGAVVVSARGRIVGAGYHRRAGGPHAEVEALRQAGPHARGATLYVNLEPCRHHGRTPPCCEALIKAGLSRVVAAMRDPNPLTNGRGLARLRRAGIEVALGVGAPEAARLNAPFIKRMTRKLPWVVVKIAQSFDGKIATASRESRWISSPASRRLAHELRRDADAVLVGVNTVRQDDPRLSVRDSARPARPGRPMRVIVDSRLRTPLTSRCLRPTPPAPVIIATTNRSPRAWKPFERLGVRVLAFRPRRGRVPLRQLCRALSEQFEATSVLIEGGGELVAGALEERLVDRAVWILAPLLVGGRASPSSVGGAGIARLAQAARLRGLQVRRLGPDLVCEAAVVYPGAR
ncbi:MAG: bifunctional diaminohydroxyphosphoribosylaminopyrimidine deaminase/5-amino-6-(5-phosphoribosylamino)uracil reductase RibD [Candidatus Omnitrophica bacterium]|nr:bifunctional diaminohydroxyphosphoribosylaminopyrimidine deaminase/5-amino-6-(5-phosphoribosylamino)uracil reductase RibD [Candidatus Omnitrophota bacterium]